MHPTEFLPFATADELEAWLAANGAARRELWVRIFKRGAGTPTVTWDDCVVAALAWGWIDGQRRALDAVSFLQRLTPRRPGSDWSQRNRAHAERLIAAGRMQPPGLAQVQAARQDGRWERAYAGSADLVIPEDFLHELRGNPAAERLFATLDRRSLYVVYHRLQTAKRPATRRRRISEMVARLARGQAFHPKARACSGPPAGPG